MPRGIAAHDEDLSGQVFGRLTLIKKFYKNTVTYYEVVCSCGQRKAVSRGSLIKGSAISCGCYREEVRGSHLKTHGLSNKSKAYSIWKNMRRRCNQPKNARYASYGGRGIFICERWNDFSLFLEDMGECPPGFSLDRIDNDGPYSKENCRWASPKQQANNTRKVVLITLGGVTKCLTDWSKELGIGRGTLKKKIAAGLIK